MLENVVKKIRSQAPQFRKLTSKYASPFYVLDSQELRKQIDQVSEAFSKVLGNIQIYYPVKINHSEVLLQECIKNDIGFDVASIRELEMVHKLGAKRMLYYAPGKTVNDLKSFLKYSNNTTLIIDSFGELKHLQNLLLKGSKIVRCGIRIHTTAQGDWVKYGIHLKELRDFYDECKKVKNLELVGIHFHTSRNKTSERYTDTIEKLGRYLKSNFSNEELSGFSFLDFGGGFEIKDHEGVFKTPQDPDTVEVLEADPLEDYARDIAESIQRWIKPLGTFQYFTEAGRYLVSGAMHIVTKITDVKSDTVAITDAGVNMVGWQRFQFEYFPLISLDNYNSKPLMAKIYGNLCTTWDIWGYSIYAKKLIEGDYVIVPNQGALTYSLAQNFINQIPPVYKLPQ